MSDQQDPIDDAVTDKDAMTDKQGAEEAVGAGKSPGGGSAAVAWLALILVLAIAAGGGWLVWEAQQREAAVVQRLAALETRVEPATDQGSEWRSAIVQLGREFTGTLERRLEKVLPTLEQQASRLQQLESGMREQLQQLESQVQEQRQALARISGGDSDSWLLAEVEYLLRLANQRLIMTGDTDSAQALLKSADNILRQLDDATLYPVRRALAVDLAALRAVPDVDTEGLYLRLSALSDQVADLVLFELPARAEPEEDVEDESWQARLRQGYEEALHKLSRYVVVRRREVPVEALVDPQWEGLLRQNTVMLLEQAQVALLSGNQRLYRESLQRARRWVDEFFVADERSATAIARELDALVKQEIEVPFPDVSHSLEVLEQAVSRRLQRVGDE
ncbi:uroporphyrinogen-III C-methyltransferase [Kineobactrum sediminis]|uniref:uroporphyrinogen-III C-methyltransferase n=1 Tax=Kineobactrum sediminis TaxID=1905677 RepID=UPI00138FC7A1|nr:uroporphyrinogen-III C-methyltransferase [Kineobactrum sediminis]